jgi:hypothetical protein
MDATDRLLSFLLIGIAVHVAALTAASRQIARRGGWVQGAVVEAALYKT